MLDIIGILSSGPYHVGHRIDSCINLSANLSANKVEAQHHTMVPCFLPNQSVVWELPWNGGMHAFKLGFIDV